MTINTENGVVVGNVYDKYATKNPVARFLMKGFLRSFDQMVARTAATTVTEAGCGDGMLTLRLARQGKRIVSASDLSSGEIEKTRARFGVTAEKDLALRVASIYELTPKTDAAELVVCCEVLEHLKNPEEALRVLASLARPYLLVSVPREPIWRLLNMLRFSYLRDWGNTPGHLQHWSKGGFGDFLRQQPNLEIVAVASPFPWTMALCRVPSGE